MNPFAFFEYLQGLNEGFLTGWMHYLEHWQHNTGDDDDADSGS